MKVLITGIAGFVGSHFCDYFLTQKGVKIYGIERPGCSTANIDHIKDKLAFYSECDIKDAESIKGVLKKIKPDFIIHLAAQASPSFSWQTPVPTIETNVIGQINLFESARNLKINPKIIVAGSCEQYGLVKKSEIPIKETHDLRPLNTYAVSKVAQDFLGYQYYKSYGLNVIRTRPFHHTGPRRPEHFVCSSFAKQIALIEKKKQQPVISVGNLNAIRDFTDVRDMVRAYWLIMQKGIVGEVYNICSGQGHSIRSILEILLSMSEMKVKIKADKNRMRPNDVPVFIGDCLKMRRITGWRPEIPFKDTLRDLLDYWRAKV